MPTLERLAATNNVNLSRAADFDVDGLWFRITPEPSNPADTNAIMVCAENGERVGYLPRESAVKYAPVIRELAERNELWCRGSIGGGRKRDGWAIGVWLQLLSPAELAKIASARTAKSIVLIAEKWDQANRTNGLAMRELEDLVADKGRRDGADHQAARAQLEKAVRQHVRASKALLQAVEALKAS